MNTNTRTKWIVVLALAVLFAIFYCLPAKASEPVFVTTYTSQQGESLDAFAVRIARDAIDRSMAIGVAGEICGEFREADGVYVIDMYTIGAWKACSYMRVKAHNYIGLTYHTHVANLYGMAVGLAFAYTTNNKPRR